MGSKRVYRHLLLERRKLDALEIGQVQRNILFLKQRYCLHRPKQLKLLAWKVWKTRMAKQVHSLTDHAGKRLTRTSEISAAFRDFYPSLYSSSSPNREDILSILQQHFKDKRLSADHVRLLDAPITPEEVQGVIKLLKNGKSLGNNGFPVEFYKRYPQHLVPRPRKPLMRCLPWEEFHHRGLKPLW